MPIEQNTDNVAQNVTKRDIKRNTSNQIVSYTIPEDSNQEYGYHKVPATVNLFDKVTYGKTIGRLSDELIQQLPDIPREIVRQNYVDETKLYAPLPIEVVAPREPAPTNNATRGGVTPPSDTSTPAEPVDVTNEPVVGGSDRFDLELQFNTDQFDERP